MATNLRKKLKKFGGMAEAWRPLVIDPDLIELFRNLGEKNYSAVILAIIVQKIAHIAAKTKPLNLEMQDYFDLFPFIDPRYLRKSVYVLREYNVWKNKKYIPHTNMASYTNIRISWPAVARLAKKVQKQKNEVRAMCQKMNKEVQNVTNKCHKH